MAVLGLILLPQAQAVQLVNGEVEAGSNFRAYGICDLVVSTCAASVAAVAQHCVQAEGNILVLFPIDIEACVQVAGGAGAAASRLLGLAHVVNSRTVIFDDGELGNSGTCSATRLITQGIIGELQSCGQGATIDEWECTQINVSSLAANGLYAYEAPVELEECSELLDIGDLSISQVPVYHGQEVQAGDVYQTSWADLTPDAQAELHQALSAQFAAAIDAAVADIPEGVERDALRAGLAQYLAVTPKTVILRAP